MKLIKLKTIELTRECLARFWQRNYKFAVNYFSDDIVGIGSRQEQFIIGKKNVEADLDCDTKEIQSCHLLKAEFHIVVSTPKMYAIAGRYLITTDESVESFLQVQQRCTFVWKNTNDGLKISHIHISSHMGELSLAENEKFIRLHRQNGTSVLNQS